MQTCRAHPETGTVEAEPVEVVPTQNTEVEEDDFALSKHQTSEDLTKRELNV